MKASWPTADEVDEVLVKEAEYLTDVSHDFRVRLKKMMELRGKASKHCISLQTSLSSLNRRVT